MLSKIGFDTCVDHNSDMCGARRELVGHARTLEDVYNMCRTCFRHD